MKNELSVYWSSFEFAYEKNNVNLKGGFVYCLVKAFDARDAINKIESALKLQNLICIKMDYVSIYEENMEWETEEQTRNFNRLYNMAQNNRDVNFDDFYSYQTD